MAPIFSGAIENCFMIRSSPATAMLMRFRWLMKQGALRRSLRTSSSRRVLARGRARREQYVTFGRRGSWAQGYSLGWQVVGVASGRWLALSVPIVKGGLAWSESSPGLFDKVLHYHWL